MGVTARMVKPRIWGWTPCWHSLPRWANAFGRVKTQGVARGRSPFVPLSHDDDASNAGWHLPFMAGTFRSWLAPSVVMAGTFRR